MARGALRTLQLAGIVLAVWLAIRVVLAAWLEVAAFDVEVGWSDAALGVSIGVVGYLCSIVMWHRLAHELGGEARLVDFSYLCVVSNLGRYVPGKIWQVLGAAALARQAGIAPGVAAASSIVFVGFLVSSGAILGLAFSPWMKLPGAVWWPAACIVGATTLLLARPTLLNQLFRRTPAGMNLASVVPIRRHLVAEQLVGNSLIWLVQGAALFVFAGALGSPHWSEFGRLTGAYVLSYVTGLVALFAPGGLGVREGMLGYLLSSEAVGGIPAHVLSVAARILFTAYEFTTIALVIAIRFGVRRWSQRLS